MGKKKLHIIANPNAKHGKKSCFAQVEARLKERGADYTLCFSERRGHLTELARQISAAGEGILVAMGGDGTLNETVCGMENFEKVPLALIPAGTGNDFAEAAGVPWGAAAVDFILDGSPKPTDFLECSDGRRSINIAGLGIDVDILMRCERKKHGSARGKYYRSLLASLMHYRGANLTITAEGKTERVHALIAAACNGRQFGGGIQFCPPALLDDGKLDLVYVDQPPRIQVPRYLFKLNSGRILEIPFTHHLLCEEVRIVPDEPSSVQYDGEVFPARELSVRVVTGKLQMYRG